MGQAEDGLQTLLGVSVTGLSRVRVDNDHSVHHMLVGEQYIPHAVHHNQQGEEEPQQVPESLMGQHPSSFSKKSVQK